MNDAPILRRGLGLLGGTFDPVHAGHLALASAVLTAIPLIRVEFIPAGDPWQKHGISPGLHRLNMLRIAVEYEPRFRVSTAELCRSGPTYTIDTVRSLRQEVGPAMPLVLILGFDQWRNLTTWRSWQTLTDYVHIAWCNRAGAEPAPIDPVQTAWAEPRTAAPCDLIHSPCGRIACFDMPPHRANATAVRRIMSAYPFSAAMKRLDGWLPIGVAQYIRMHRLYGSRQ